MVLEGPGPFVVNGNYEVNSFHSIPAGFSGGEVYCVTLTRMEVVYSKRRPVTYAGKQLQSSLASPLRGGCKDQGPVVERSSTLVSEQIIQPPR